MRYVPHEYQEYAKEFIISHKVSALFLDCGLGKTVITLTAIWELLFDYFDIRKILIIGPLRVSRDTWPAELEKWDHLSGVGMSVALGSEKERLSALGRKAQVYVINRENVEWLVNESGIPFDFDMVVIDELSSFKSHKAKRFKALKKVRPMVRRIVGLTGTPAPNGLIDLWAEIGILDMGQRLGRFIGGYRERFFVPDKRSREMVFSYKPREGAEDMIYELISDICISMKAVDYLDMPECVYNRVEVVLSEKEMALYEQLERDMLLAVQGSMIGRDDKNGPQGSGVNEDVSFTLTERVFRALRHCVLCTVPGLFIVTFILTFMLLLFPFRVINVIPKGKTRKWRKKG